MPFLLDSNPKQFGYKRNTSCKSAYFVLNETMQYYKRVNSKVHLISLDASKAFDKLWRSGLFYKLIDVVEPPIWRLLLSYYAKSKLTVSFNGKFSKVFDTQEGVKQGGIISPYLFNYFVNDLLNQNDSLNIGAKIGTVNVSMIAYCDDLILISPTETHMRSLIKLCESYAVEWKIEFNASKSIAYSHGYSCKPSFSLNNLEIPHQEFFIYLGLPVGDDSFVWNYFEEKMSKVEKSFYSLRGLGCKPSDLSPKTIAFVFKQFCQPIIKYGFENLYLNESKLRLLNIRQNILLKRTLGLSIFCRTKPLFQVLKIEQLTQLYLKHKIFFLRQILSNDFTRSLFNLMSSLYQLEKPNERSFFFQLSKIEFLTSTVPTIANSKRVLESIESTFKCNDEELISNLNILLDQFNNVNFYFITKQLNSFLKISDTV